MRKTYTDQKPCIFLVQIPETVNMLFINWSNHFILKGWFQIYCGNKNTLLLLYACKVINLINKGVTSQYVQRWGGILLKFNILSIIT